MKSKNKKLFICIFISCIISVSSLICVYAYTNAREASANDKNIIKYKQLQASINDINKKTNLQNPDDSLQLEDKKVKRVDNFVKDTEKFLNTKDSINLSKNQFENLQMSVSKTINKKINGKKTNIRIVTFSYYGTLFGFYNNWCYVQWWNKKFVASKLIAYRCPAGIKDFFAVKIKDKIGLVTVSLDSTEYPLPHPKIINTYVLAGNKILTKPLYNIKSIKRNDKYWSYSFKSNWIMFKFHKDDIDFIINSNKNGFNIKCKNKVWKFKFINGLLTYYLK